MYIIEIMKYQTINQANKVKICNGLDVIKYTLMGKCGKNGVMAPQVGALSLFVYYCTGHHLFDRIVMRMYFVTSGPL